MIPSRRRDAERCEEMQEMQFIRLFTDGIDYALVSLAFLASSSVEDFVFYSCVSWCFFLSVPLLAA